jgi:hypothetical protein
VTRRLRGEFSAAELQWYLFGKAALFWGLIALAWYMYPTEHHYSIMSHTFSFLGSPAEEHSPRWWWLFSIAMTVWGVGLTPVVFYLHRQFAEVSPWGARVGAGLFLLGCISTVMVAMFPDVSTPLFGKTRWTDIHERAAVLVAIGFGLGIPWFGVLLLRDRLRGDARRFRLRRFIAPYLLWNLVIAVAAYNQISWGQMYAERKAAAAATGAHVGSSWSESINTIYAFPLWENICIYTMFGFLVWFALAARDESEQ